MLDLITEFRGFRKEMNVRFDEVDGHFTEIKADFNGVYDRLDHIDGRLDKIDGRLDAVEGRVGGLEKGMITKDQFDTSFQRIIDNESRLVDVLCRKKFLSNKDVKDVFQVSQLPTAPGSAQ